MTDVMRDVAEETGSGPSDIRSFRVSFTDSDLTELRLLALHGLLHLLGYDHERDNGRMLKVERRLRRQGGLREGLIEREQR